VFGLALDNASNNDTMVDELQALLPGSICGAHTRIRCICHIMNLAVKAILSQFSRKKSGFENSPDGGSDDEEDQIIDDEEEEDDIDLARQASNEAVLEEITRKAEKVHKLSVVEDNLGRFAVRKVWLLVSHTRYISYFHSALRSQSWQNTFLSHRLLMLTSVNVAERLGSHLRRSNELFPLGGTRWRRWSRACCTFVQH
jgi:hypothetical protein